MPFFQSNKKSIQKGSCSSATPAVARSSPLRQGEPLSSSPLAGRQRDNNDTRRRTSYKGFHTSITAIFTDPSSIRTDCCSISCCGILQSDYNRYLLHQKRPPTWKNRLVQFILIPLGLFALAGYAAVFVRDPLWNEVFSTALLFMTIFWIVGGCLYSTKKRAKLRRDILRVVKNGEHSERAGGDEMAMIGDDADDDDETKWNTYCVHRLCGCYPVDSIIRCDNEDARRQGNDHVVGGDLCSFFSKCFTAACCGKLGCCQLQLCGACALAQEGRELESMIPKEKRRLDYVTFQPYVEYLNPIRKLRMEQNGKLWSHYAALSKLSRILLKTLVSIIVLLLFVSGVLSPQRFQWGNMLVFVATFLQAFGVLYFVHWQWNRFDISLDAVIKYFACGFAISTTLAITFELIINIFLELVAIVIILWLPLKVEDGQGYGEDYNLYTGPYLDVSPFHALASESSKEYRRALSRKYPFISVLFLFLSAYFVAAMVEEMCKYFGFKMVEHPDFLSEQELQKAAAHGVPERSDEEEDRFELGGGLEYVNASQSGTSEYESFDSYEHVNSENRNLSHPATTAQSPSTSTPHQHHQHHHETAAQGEGTRALRYIPVQLVDAPRRSIHSLASSITVAMVSVSLGFACCENLIYIFLYNGQSLSMEISVLISRSLFPVHPLCAALQSIGVCQQQLENDKSMGVGRIIFPAFILHGTFDFSIMLLSFLAMLDAKGDEDNESMTYSILALCISVVLVVCGMCYYIRQSHRQSQRLEQMDRSRNFVGIYS